MILIVGGAASGKRTYAKSLGFSENDFSDSPTDSHAVLVSVQELVRTADVDLDALVDAIASNKRVAICTEVGSGIVPLSAEDRAWRDRVGTLQKGLAQRSEVVVRMVCGIPVGIKGQLPS